MAKIKTICIIAVSLFCFIKGYSSTINNVDFKFDGKNIIITYDLLSSNVNEASYVTIGVYNQSNYEVVPKNISGDYGSGVKVGNGKQITWNAREDGYIFDESITIKLTVISGSIIPMKTHVVKSVIWPGWGDYKLRNGKAYLLYGLVGYGSLGASIYYNNQAYTNYNNYLSSNEIEKSNNYFKASKQNNTLSYVFLGLASAVWIADITGVLAKTTKAKNNPSIVMSSEYYKEISMLNNSTTKTKMICTKTPLEIATEKGDQYYANQEYEEAKFEYLKVIDLDNTNEKAKIRISAIEKILNDRKILEENYRAAINNGDKKYVEKEYEAAINQYEVAISYKPSETYPRQKISEIRKLQQQIVQDKLDENYRGKIKDADIAFEQKEFNKAKKLYEEAREINPDETYPSSKIQEIEYKSSSYNLPELIKVCRKTVCYISLINPYTMEEVGSGSGFIVSPNGICVTNAHVLQATNSISNIRVTFEGNSTIYEIEKILDSNSVGYNDYAIIKLKTKRNDFSYVKIAKNEIQNGESVYAIGNPEGLENTASNGIVSAYRGPNNEIIQTTANIAHGSSGGPLFNMRGEVVGITTMGNAESNLYFAVNIKLLKLYRYIK